MRVLTLLAVLALPASLQAAPPYTGEPISIDVKGADLEDVFRLFAHVGDLNVVLDPSLKGKTLTIKLDGVPWDQALDVVLDSAGVGSVLEGNVLRVAPRAKLTAEEQQRKQLQEARELAGELETVLVPLSWADASDVQAIVRKSLSARGDVVVDERRNALIIRDLPSRLEEIVGRVGVPAGAGATTSRGAHGLPVSVSLVDGPRVLAGGLVWLLQDEEAELVLDGMRVVVARRLDGGRPVITARSTGASPLRWHGPVGTRHEIDVAPGRRLVVEAG